MTENKWLVLAGNRINYLVKKCKEDSFKSSCENGIDLNEISYLLNSSKVEIEKLQNLLNEKK